MLKILFILGVFAIVMGTTYYVFTTLKLGHLLDLSVDTLAVWGSFIVVGVVVLVLCGDGVIGHKEIVGALERFLDWLHR